MLKCLNVKMKMGFTLIEMLVAIGIFAIMTVALTGIFISATQSQSHTLYTQELMIQSSYALEYMGRILRMAKKDNSSGSCTGTAYANYNPVSGTGNTITFLDYNNKCHQFLLESERIKEKKSTDHTSGNLGSAIEVTSSTVKINNLTFNVVGGSNTDNLQPKVTILIDAEANTKKVDPVPKIKVQTTISQRHLDTQE